MAAMPRFSPPKSSPGRTGTLRRNLAAIVSRRLLSAAIVAVATAVVGHMATAASITPLLDPSVSGPYTSSAFGISGDGSIVVGGLAPSGGDGLAYVWQNGVATSLGPSTGSPNPISNRRQITAIDTNLTGSVIGGEQTNGFNLEGWVSVNGLRTVLTGPNSGTQARVRGLSDNGQTAVGFSTNAGTTQGWTWTAAGGYTLVAGSSTANTEARGISGDGSVVIGKVGDASARWVNGGTAELLGSIFTGGDGAPNGISQDRTTIVGYETDPNAPTFLARAFSWSGGSITQLPISAGFDYTFANAVSGDGSRIVGNAGDNVNFEDRAVLWTPAQGMLDLNVYLPTLGVDLTGWVLQYAEDISDDGFKIVGEGQLNGVTTGFLVDLTPVPEPSTVALAAIGIAGAGIAFRRRQLARSSS